MNRNQARKKIRKIASLLSELDAAGYDPETEYHGIEFRQNGGHGYVAGINHQGNTYVAEFYNQSEEDNDDD